MDRLEAVRRWARVLWVVTLGAMGVICVAIVAVLVTGYIPEDLRAAAALAPEADVPFGRYLGAWALGVVPALAMLVALNHMRALFARYAEGEVLTEPCARRIRGTGVWLLAVAALGWVARTGQVLVLSLGNPPGDRVLAISFGSAELQLVLAGGLLLTIGWVMGEAARIAEDNRGFV